MLPARITPARLLLRQRCARRGADFCGAVEHEEWEAVPEVAGAGKSGSARPDDDDVESAGRRPGRLTARSIAVESKGHGRIDRSLSIDDVGAPISGEISPVAH